MYWFGMKWPVAHVYGRDNSNGHLAPVALADQDALGRGVAVAWGRPRLGRRPGLGKTGPDRFPFRWAWSWVACTRRAVRPLGRLFGEIEPGGATLV
jgi:hypothetical protein